jgi:hypothetical protein
MAQVITNLHLRETMAGFIDFLMGGVISFDSSSLASVNAKSMYSVFISFNQPEEYLSLMVGLVDIILRIGWFEI